MAIADAAGINSMLTGFITVSVLRNPVLAFRTS